MISREQIDAALRVAQVAGLTGDKAVRYASGVLAVETKTSTGAARQAIINQLQPKPPERAGSRAVENDTQEAQVSAAEETTGSAGPATEAPAGKKRANSKAKKSPAKPRKAAQAARKGKAGGKERGKRASRTPATGPRPGTIGAFIIERKKAGDANDAIAKKAAVKFPKAESTDKAAVAWYVWNAVKRGWLSKTAASA